MLVSQRSQSLTSLQEVMGFRVGEGVGLRVGWRVHVDGEQLVLSAQTHARDAILDVTRAHLEILAVGGDRAAVV